MVREIYFLRQTVDCLHGRDSERYGYISLECLGDDGDDEVEVLLDVSAKREERMEDLALRELTLIREFPVEDLEEFPRQNNVAPTPTDWKLVP